MKYTKGLNVEMSKIVDIPTGTHTRVDWANYDTRFLNALNDALIVRSNTQSKENLGAFLNFHSFITILLNDLADHR